MGEHQILAAKLKREIDGVGPSLTNGRFGGALTDHDLRRENNVIAPSRMVRRNSLSFRGDQMSPSRSSRRYGATRTHSQEAKDVALFRSD
jgi:hypothetical protein